MAFWTPRDLTNIEYIRANFTERDKSLALEECLRSLPNAIKNEATLSAQELALRDQLNNGPYSFSNVRTLRQRSNELQNDPNATAQQRADAYTAWQNAQAERDSLNSTYTQVSNNLTAANEYTNNLEQGIANLRQLGATAPTNSTQPSGNESLAEPQQVVQGQNTPIVQTVNTPTIDTTATGTALQTEQVSGQQVTNVGLGANPINEFATDTNLVVQGIDFVPTPVETTAGQQATNVSLGTNPLNEFVTDTNLAIGISTPINDFATDIQTQQDIVDNAGNDGGGEDSVLDQVGTNQSDLVNSTVEPDVFGSDTELEPDQDPNLGDRDQEEEQVENGTSAPYAKSNVQGVTGGVNSAQNQAGLQYGVNFSSFQDWRVRLKLAPGANYLYKAPASQRGILAPLNRTDGVIFPYTPQITVNYVANYDPTNPTHSNYKIMQYQNSAVDAVQIACDFTAQDTNEANYVLATIHFFRSVTKMFYGQDENPKRGTPPPLCYLVGLGEFQFDMHPLVITAFTYTLPDDVDYIRAMPATGQTGSDVNNSGQGGTSNNRLLGTSAGPGATAPNAQFQTPQGGQMGEPTYVPTRIKIQLSCMPVVSRKDISEEFSLKQYANGSLLRGSQRDGGGIW